MKLEKLPFWKMTAGGNDFILLDNRSSPSLNLSPSDISALCSRRVSVGADGLILMEISEKADIKMVYFNADGSLAALCANGVRCMARLAFNIKIAQKRIKIETGAGIFTAEDKGKNISLKMLPPSKLQLNINLTLDDEVINGHFIDVGVPFYVVPYQEIDSCVVKELGRRIRHHDFFLPYGGSNVSFFKVEDKNNLWLRIYERGVEDETLSSGTGCLATSLVSAALGFIEAPVNCHTQGGTIVKVTYNYQEGKFSNLSIEGYARLIYKGKIYSQD